MISLRPRPELPRRLGRLAGLGLILLFLSPAAAGATWTFTDVTSAAGFTYVHGIVGGITNDLLSMMGGVAAGDYDGDGWVDLYAVRGDIGPNLLFRNKGDGTFEEVGAAAGVDVTGTVGCGPVFADYDGDGDLDLFIGKHKDSVLFLFENNGDGTFSDVTGASGIGFSGTTFSTAFADYDEDGDLDMLMAHWGSFVPAYGHLWQNQGGGVFADVDTVAGVEVEDTGLSEWTYTGNFADINSDGHLDILYSSDFNQSQVFLSDGSGGYTDITDTTVITDENGMGGAVGDYDNDLDLDWFVSSISPQPGPSKRGTSGNRLYANDGTGVFSDVTDDAGVRTGHWGWGSSFADFNNDGWLDLFHVNGIAGTATWNSDPCVFFVANGDCTFTERAAEFGVDDTGQGRGIACFDYDRDGDLDIFVANNDGAPVFYRNDGGNANAYLAVRLIGAGLNTEAVGARLYATAGGTTQMRELRCGSNFESQDPTCAHFGLGSATVIDSLEIRWPNGDTDVLYNLPVNLELTLEQNNITSVTPGVARPEPGVTLQSLSPNPLVTESTFRFRVPRESPVRLAIYDASGREIRTLVERSMSGGEHDVRWDGRDRNGRRVASGVYLYRLDSTREAARGKIAVVR